MWRSTLLSTLFLAAVSLAIEIPAVPTWPTSGRCTDKSLTIPSWIITKYKVSGGTTTFQIANRAAEVATDIGHIECTADNKCSGYGIDELRATISTGSDGRRIVGVSQLWQCGETGDKYGKLPLFTNVHKRDTWANQTIRIIFIANGTTVITQCSGSDCVSPITYLVYGTLSLPVPLTPTQPSPPTGYGAPACASIGKSQWTVSGISFQNYTKGQCKQWYGEDQYCLDNNGGTFIAKGVHLKLNITNNAISHTVACIFEPGYYDPYPPSTLRCAGGKFNEITLDVTWTGVAPDFGLKVEELWYCLENPDTNDSPSVLVASGNASFTLNCETHTGITGTANDIVTLCTDSVGSHAIDGIQVARQTLPPFSLVTAYPVHGGCTFDSVANPTFYYRGMYFETSFPAENKNNVTLQRFTAGLTGPGFADFFFYEYKIISGSGVDAVHSCTVYYDGKPKEQHWLCTYQFNPHTKTINQVKVWECRDKNGTNPLFFEGSGSFDWSIDPYSHCTDQSNYKSCYWTDSLANSQPGIPYSIPKVTVSLVNNQPPDYGWPPSVAMLEMPSPVTERVNGKWQRINP
ncbi:uncharacterized protein BDR25DRAFT_373427 [Lindgomyces ingoldianus]|uniref:Uncharacterized protein n=1 Tax=Lindgomyces ingoldianus TaxID=673940 RepID=A0ACB6QN94_9PLEO|nr:uncharacterized protein BDR25DRAFT_373427 [Lindgomyces ingoldianus]KAF2468360.1 hypothetical protein BDR25DRAFT_373427 [Lindgomyces ingoldianus]